MALRKCRLPIRHEADRFGSEFAFFAVNNGYPEKSLSRKSALFVELVWSLRVPKEFCRGCTQRSGSRDPAGMGRGRVNGAVRDVSEPAAWRLEAASAHSRQDRSALCRVRKSVQRAHSRDS